ncbi:MAG TPA: OsmC family peroxiredoxin [candidate division Zixibacteria bacterium]|nr:OsmC family peroxiredoxin [candidate division Zixibacteria bacterium]
MVEAKLKWAGGVKFDGISAFGLPISIDGTKKTGGTEQGYKPTQLVMYGLAGCTGVDVVIILKKMRQELTGLEVEVKASQPDEYPKPFNRIDIKYTLRGKNLDRSKVERAIKLSEEKYCAVSLTMKGVAKIETSIEIIEE